MIKIKILTAMAVAGLMLSGCAELKLPKLPKVQSSKQTTDINNISTKKANELTKKGCETLLKMEKEAKEAKKIADEEKRVKGLQKVEGNIILDAADKQAQLNKIYYLTEKIKYCKELGREKVNIDIEKIMEKNR